MCIVYFFALGYCVCGWNVSVSVWVGGCVLYRQGVPEVAEEGH